MIELSDDVVVLTARDRASDADLALARYVPDADEFPGPLVAVSRGLAAARHDVALIVGGDMPLVPLRVLDMIAAQLVESDAPVCGLALGEVIQQLPLGVRRDLVFEPVETQVAAGESRLGALARLDGALAIAEPAWRALDPDGDSLRDIDTAEDLAALLREPSDA
jgi:molybdopterin-guanine dinucleotide biosynthesis protein A